MYSPYQENGGLFRQTVFGTTWIGTESRCFCPLIPNQIHADAKETLREENLTTDRIKAVVFYLHGWLNPIGLILVKNRIKKWWVMEDLAMLFGPHSRVLSWCSYCLFSVSLSFAGCQLAQEQPHRIWQMMHLVQCTVWEWSLHMYLPSSDGLFLQKPFV